jgi:Tfp pilus assembly protein PilE
MRNLLRLKFRKSQGGFSIVEAIIGVTILAFVFIGLIAAYNQYIHVSNNTIPLIQASNLLEEGIEATKTLRDVSWALKISTLSTSTSYYLSFSASTSAWSATTTSSLIDNLFLRTMTLSDVKRDVNNRIVISGGVYDSNTKLITVSVAWKNSKATTTRSLQTYITNLFSN